MTDDQGYMSELRKRAERRLQNRLADPLKVPPELLPQLAHELQVHQIELEMQNEELRRSYRELEDARYRFADLFDLAPLGYFILDNAGQIVQTNIAGTRLLGAEQVALVGRRFHHYAVEDCRDALHLHLRSAFRNKVALKCELEMQRQDGSRFVAQLNSCVHRNRRKGRGECLTVVSDISEQKAAEATMRTAQKTSEEACSAKTRFLAAASHDLRQPLQALTTIGDLLRRRLHAPEDLELLRFHTEALTGMRELLDALLEVSRLDAGAITPNVQSVPVAPLLQKLDTQHRLLARSKGLHLRVAHCSAVVQSDPVLLRQILDNLVANAIRYTEEGRLLVGCRRSGDAIRIEVWDTGMGIPEEEQERIFEDFYQLSNFARDASKGLGLGLSIVQRTARLLGHPIGINTRRRGSVFTITVPLAPAGSDSQTFLQTDPSGPSYATTAVTILLVEDDDIVRKAMAMMLDSSGYRVIAATGGTEALSEIRDATQVPDIILTDYRLAGGETGPQVVEAVQDILGTDVPALILTGDVELTDVPGMSDRRFPVLQKPVAPDSLRSEIQRLLAEHQ